MGTATLFVSSSSPSGLSAGSTTYAILAANASYSGQTNTTETDNQAITETAGVFSNLGIRTTACAATATGTVITHKNAATNGAQTATIPASPSGIGFFEDVSNTDTVSAGEKWAAKVVSGTGGTTTVTCVSILFTATTNTVT